MAAEATEQFIGTQRKVTAHLTQDEGLSFEKSAPGKKAYRLAPLDVPEVDAASLLGSAYRAESAELPELSEIEIVRHFTRLSTWNYAIDLGMYPLGSCTMKYNPRVNEFVSRLEGIAEAHPYQPEALSQGSLGIIRLLQQCLTEITGMDAITLQPAAGAHGEFTGILLARAYHEAKGNPRKTVIIPDSAHGTNPATARSYSRHPYIAARPSHAECPQYGESRSQTPQSSTDWSASAPPSLPSPPPPAPPRPRRRSRST